MTLIESVLTTAWTTAPIFVVSGACVLLHLLWAKNGKLLKDNTSKWRRQNLVPLAPTGFFDSVRKLCDSQAPFHLLQLTRSTFGGVPNIRLPIPIGVGGLHVIGDPDLARRIFLDAATTKPRRVYKTFQPGGTPHTKTLFHSTTDLYAKSVRRSVARAFSKKEIERMREIAVQRGQEWIYGCLKKFVASGEAFDPGYEMTRLTFSVLNEAAFEYEPTVEEFETFTHHAEVALREFAFQQMSKPWRQIFGVVIPEVRRANASFSELRAYTRKVFETYRSNPSKSDQTTIIQLFSDADYFEYESQRESEAVVWIFAGQDTTGFTLGNAITELAKHPVEQQKVRDALLASNYNRNGSAPSAKDCACFRYALTETMRLVPVIAVGPIRETGRDIACKKTSDGKGGDSDAVIPKGAVCLLSQFVCNRNPEVFPDPDKFRPERWENETIAMKQAKLHFALGPRNCPGQYLATSEIFSLLPLILTQYSFELVAEGSLDHNITLRNKGSMVRAKQLSQL